MKKLLLLLLPISLCSSALLAQGVINITHAAYSTMKANGQLDITKNYLFTDAVAPVGPPQKYQGETKSPSTICSCMVPLDTSFSYAPFVSYGTDPTLSVYGANHMNDDASTMLMSLPFNFDFYGAIYTSLFINNNGNVSFTMPYSQYTANPFPDPSFQMIAPFWGDVDTRDFAVTGSDVVYYKMTPTALIVKWENVGYYNQHFDKLNTFQLILTDGTDPILPPGMNVGYCYGDMQWTTGDITGSSGFGSPATVGVNQGNGVDYFQVGAFNHPGPGFDGPYNTPDGIDWLDNQGMYFDVASPGNIPPVIINNNICDTIDVFTGDTLHLMNMDSVEFTLGISTPEISQTVTGSLYSTDTNAFSYTMTLNTPTYKEYHCKFIARNLATGLHYVYLTATDDGSPVKSTSTQIVIRSNYDPGLATGITAENDVQANWSVYPNPTEGQLNIHQEFPATAQAHLVVYDLVGKIVLNKALTSADESIDITKLESGVYFVNIQSTLGSSKTQKIIKK